MAPFNIKKADCLAFFGEAVCFIKKRRIFFAFSYRYIQSFRPRREFFLI